MTQQEPSAARAITERVIRSFDGCPDERLREIMQGLVRHLHAFVADARLTEAEWMAGIQFLTRVGQTCTDTRQECILLSDALGVSMLVDALNHGRGTGATESTVLGPFYVSGSPWRSNGDALAAGTDGEPLLARGRVQTIQGEPVPGAVVDVWQNAANMMYAVQDPSQPEDNLRGRFRTGADGRFWFRSIRPVDYPIPSDGPVGDMLAATGRHPWRPAHIHLIVSATGYESVTTHIFDAASPYLASDAVFAVKDSLVRQFRRHDPRAEEPPSGFQGPWYTVDCAIVLEPAAQTGAKHPST